jgi:hypothetical protein
MVLSMMLLVQPSGVKEYLGGSGLLRTSRDMNGDSAGVSLGIDRNDVTLKQLSCDTCVSNSAL